MADLDFLRLRSTNVDRVVLLTLCNIEDVEPQHEETLGRAYAFMAIPVEFTYVNKKKMI